MKVTLPLDQMTTADKLQVIEQLWEDLQRSPDEVPSPAWHTDVLAARESRIAAGRAKFVDWGEAKARIRQQL